MKAFTEHRFPDRLWQDIGALVTSFWRTDANFLRSNFQQECSNLFAPSILDTSHN